MSTSVEGLPRGVSEWSELEQGLYVARIAINEIREQDINAQVLQPREFERLVENIRERGTLESLPYCVVVDGVVEVVSGHHRVRAARDAGKKTMWVLVDTLPMTRSQIRAKQIAHNALVGQSNEEILRKMVAEITEVEDLLATGLPDDMLPLPDLPPSPVLSTPHADFEWRTVAITFLPHQFDSFREVVAHLDGQQEMVGVAPVECFDGFASYLAQFARFRNIRSVGTTVAVLTRIAQDIVAMGEPQSEDWVKLESVLYGDAMPAAAGAVLREALAKRAKREGFDEETPLWRVLEVWAAEEMAS